ncbi:hypothetical protein [Lacticaseibacillus paracasei]|nr:hypothetical protein [Lacticaseibacillus paracasei]
MQFPINNHTNIRAGQAIRFNRVELAVSIHAADCLDHLERIPDRIGDRH